MPDPSTATTETVSVNGTEQTITAYGPYEVLAFSDLTDEECEHEDLYEDNDGERSWFRVPNHPDDAAENKAKGEPTHTLYDLGDFSADWGITRGSGHPYQGWDGYMSDSAFSACLVRYCCEDGTTDCALGGAQDYVMFGRVSW